MSTLLALEYRTFPDIIDVFHMPLTIRTPLPAKIMTKVTFTIIYFYFSLYVFTQLCIPKQYRLVLPVFVEYFLFF